MKALVLTVCSKQKSPKCDKKPTVSRLPDLQQLRYELLNLVRNNVELAQKQPNLDGILNESALATNVFDLYDGVLYKQCRDKLKKLPSNVKVLVVSAFYGLVEPHENLKTYELRMDDELSERQKVWQFWYKKGLNSILKWYIVREEVGIVWSLLPNLYGKIFDIPCWSVFAVTKSGKRLGNALDYVRGRWLKFMLENPQYLFCEPLREIPGLDYIFVYR